ncbi:MAG: BON domain-containing protein [Verrucomicrobia bacterium]|jgi:osmotically-inducible protein OsmY|nr:BON domain-containing protein [Verrucomicrobiota bacterium]
MRKFINGLIVGLILGVGGYWFFSRANQPRAVQQAQQRLRAVAADTLASAGQTAAQLEEMLKPKLEALELQASTVKEELEQTGKVVRRKARDAGAVVADAAAEAQITAVIKAKLAADSELSAWNIAVNTTGSVVTLSGTVSSADLIGRAVLLALETKGVTQVVSTLQVK